MGCLRRAPLGRPLRLRHAPLGTPGCTRRPLAASLVAGVSWRTLRRVVAWPGAGLRRRSAQSTSLPKPGVWRCRRRGSEPSAGGQVRGLPWPPLGLLGARAAHRGPAQSSVPDSACPWHSSRRVLERAVGGKPCDARRGCAVRRLGVGTPAGLRRGRALGSLLAGPDARPLGGGVLQRNAAERPLGGGGGLACYGLRLACCPWSPC